MLRLPGDAPTKIVTPNTQRVDIAPTLLNVLGLEIPRWMEGRSVFSLAGPEDERPLFSAGSRQGKTVEGNFLRVADQSPPWYSLGRISMVLCDQGFTVRLDELRVRQRTVEGSTRECPGSISPLQAGDMIFDHLRSRGYDWE